MAKSYDYFVGCDPGLNGGIAVVDAAGIPILVETVPQQVAPRRTPRKLKKDGTPRKAKLEISPRGLRDIVRTIAALPGEKVAALERVWSRPGEGVSSAFTFGYAYGALRQALVDHDIRVWLVLPSEWQKELLPDAMGLSSGDRHRMCLERIQDVFPESKCDLRKLTSADAAAALLIAEFVRRNPPL